jgi:hypothetical protein
MLKSTNETHGSRGPYDTKAIKNFIRETLSEVFGLAAIDRLIAWIGPETIDLWALEAIAEAHCWAKAIAFTPIQRAELCSLLWNDREKWEFDDLEFEVMSLLDRLDDVKLVFAKYVDLFDERIIP